VRKRAVWLVVSSVLLFVSMTPSSVPAQGQASVLVPISPVDIVPVNSETVIAVNDSGQVMAV